MRELEIDVDTMLMVQPTTHSYYEKLEKVIFHKINTKMIPLI